MTVTCSDSANGTLETSRNGFVSAVAASRLQSESATVTPTTFYDSLVNENTSASVWLKYQISIGLNRAYTLTNLSSSQSLTENTVSPVGSGGVGRIKVSDGTVSQIIKCNTRVTSGGTIREFTQYATGTVSKYLFDQVAAMISGTPDTAYYSTYNHATATYIRNAACWLADIDLSCVAVASKSPGGGWTRQRAGTLIAPRIVQLAAHFAFGVGTQLRFADAEGNVETPTVIAIDSASGGDIRVAVLDAAVTVATPCKIAGDWMIQGANVTSGNKSWYSGGLGIHIDQNANVYVCSIGQAASLASSSCSRITTNGSSFDDCEQSAFANHSTDIIGAGNSTYLKPPVAGDSGQPVFAIIDGEPVLLWCWLYPSGGPPVYRHNGALLNAIIASACSNAGISPQTVTVAPDPTF